MHARAQLTLASWNIGGGILGESHQLHGSAELEYHIQQIKEWTPDVLCLQEAHTYSDGHTGQADLIAKAANYEFHETVAISPSHLAEGADLSLAVLSRHPLKDVSYTKFWNPGLTNIGPNGENWILFDKGYVTASLQVDGSAVNLVNAHCFPFQYFNVEATNPQFEAMWSDFSRSLIEIAKSQPTVGAIDLNYAPIEDLLGPIFGGDLYENSFSNTATIPRGIQQDFIVYTEQSIRLRGVSVTPTKADHYYCESRFDLV